MDGTMPGAPAGSGSHSSLARLRIELAPFRSTHILLVLLLWCLLSLLLCNTTGPELCGLTD